MTLNISLVLLAAFSLVIMASCAKRHPVLTKDLYAEIKRDIPLGTSSNDVNSYLKKLGLEYSFDKATNAYYAIDRGSGQLDSRQLVSKSTQIIVKLNGDGKVIDVTVRPVYTGP